MKIILFLVQLILTAAAFVYLSQKIDFGQVYDIIRNISATSLVLALSLYCLQIFLVSYRLKLTLRFLGSEATFITIVRSVLVGMFFVQTPLSSLGGDMMRGWTLFRDGISVRTAASAVTIDRVFGFLGLIAVILCSLPSLWLRATEPGLRIGIVAMLGLAMTGVVIFIALRKMPAPLRQRFGFVDWIGQVSDEFKLILVAKKTSATILVIAVAVHFVSLLIIFVLAREVGMPVTFFEILYLTPFPLLASFLPLSIGGWGVREGAMVAAFSLIGVPAAKTLSASILFGIISLLVALPGSLVWILARFTPSKARIEETKNQRL